MGQLTLEGTHCCVFLLLLSWCSFSFVRDCAQLVYTLIRTWYLQVRPLSQSTASWSAGFFLSFRDSVLTRSMCSSSGKNIYISLTSWTLVFLSPRMGASYLLQALKMCTWGLSSWKGGTARQVWTFRLMAACVLSQTATDLWQGWFMCCVREVRIGHGVELVKSAVPRCSFPIQTAQFMLYDIGHPGFPQPLFIWTQVNKSHLENRNVFGRRFSENPVDRSETHAQHQMQW